MQPDKVKVQFEWCYSRETPTDPLEVPTDPLVANGHTDLQKAPTGPLEAPTAHPIERPTDPQDSGVWRPLRH